MVAKLKAPLPDDVQRMVKRLDLAGNPDCWEAADIIKRQQRRIAELEKALPTCDKHKPMGGARATCVVCAGIKLSGALSQISYLCGLPNEMEVSEYDLHYDEQLVVEQVRKRISELEAQRERADIINWHRIHTPDEQEIFYLSRLPSIRTVARTLGYAIGVHGSMRRDLDLIAVPWVEKHSTPDALAKAIQYAACGMHGDVVTWQQKPCGRIATSLPICWTEDNRPSSGHIDLSVMVSNVEVAAKIRM